MSADVIHPGKLFELHRSLRSALTRGNSYFANEARRALRDMSIETDDLTVAAVASKLSRPVRVYTPPYNGDAA